MVCMTQPIGNRHLEAVVLVLTYPVYSLASISAFISRLG